MTFLAKAAFLAVASMSATSSLADVTVSLAPTTQPVRAGQGEVRFDLLVLNDDPAAAGTFDAPATLPCRLTTPGGVVEATASRAGGAGSVSVAPGGFARVAYTVRIETLGRVVVELTDRPAAATVVTVLAPEAAPAPDSVPARRPRNPIEVVTQRDPNFRSEMGLVEFLGYRIKPHEPVYIVGGDEEPTTKFQLSFKYQIFDPNGPIAQTAPPLGGLYFGYSQTSLWDLGGDNDSNPFFDTSYRPELLVSYDNLDRYLVNRGSGERILPEWLKLGLQAGVRHESNGRAGEESRSLNIVYVRPVLTFSGQDGWFVSLAPGVFGYVADLSDNPDIQDYRGHADLRVVMGQGGGVQLAATARAGEGLDNRSLQLDFSFPIRQLTLGNLDVYFHTQYFMGFGESLIRYDQSDYSLRFGVSLVR